MAAVVAAAAEAEPCVLAWRTRSDAWSLRAPAPLLDGNVPLRAVQACPPFIDGSAAGLWLTPSRLFTIERGKRGALCSDPRATVTEDRTHIRLQIDTGLQLEPRGAVLAVERAHNRHDWRVEVAPQTLRGRTTLTLTLSIARALVTTPVTLDGPIASAMLVPETVRWARADRATALAMFERHEGFFDAAYFAAKREGPTRKYRAQSRAPMSSLIDPAAADVALFSFGNAAAFEGDALTLRAECAFSAEHYGAHTRCTLDAGAKSERAISLLKSLRTLRPMLREEDAPMLYLSQYIVAHSGGDAHMLVKPSVLAATAPGFSLLVDGPSDAGASVVRGVLSSEWFHAVPIVLSLHPSASVRAGSVLGRVRAIPTSMLEPRVEFQ